MSRDSYIFLTFFRLRYNCAKFHYCRICVTSYREGAFLPPSPSASVSSHEKAHLNRVNIIYQFSNKFRFKAFFQTYLNEVSLHYPEHVNLQGTILNHQWQTAWQGVSVIPTPPVKDNILSRNSSVLNIFSN